MQTTVGCFLGITEHSLTEMYGEGSDEAVVGCFQSIRNVFPVRDRWGMGLSKQWLAVLRASVAHSPVSV